MKSAERGVDALGEIFAPGDEARAGLALLAQASPLWGDRVEWIELLAALQKFESRWGAPLRLGGWSLLALYGVHPIAPRARIEKMGAGWVACLRNHQVVAVDEKAITLVTRTSARLRIFHVEPDNGAVLAWQLTD
jgi:hypothetical protein